MKESKASDIVKRVEEQWSEVLEKANMVRGRKDNTYDTSIKGPLLEKSLIKRQRNIDTLGGNREISKKYELNNDNDDMDVVNLVPKIYFCMRTNSQISQFAKEAQKVKIENLIGVCVGSRLKMCINEKVNSYRGIDIINKKCLDLIKKSGCVYHKKKENVEDLMCYIYSKVHDIEDIVKLGKRCNTCPYYSARQAMKNAEIVILTYNSILHKATRESIGISLKDSIVVIDEAHNIINAISNINSAFITQFQVL